MYSSFDLCNSVLVITKKKLAFMVFVLVALFESQSLGTSIVRLRNIVSGRFLAINSKGRIITQVWFLSSPLSRVIRLDGA